MIKVHYQLHTNAFDALLYDENKEAEKTGEEMICAILYLEKFDKSRFSDLKKRVKNDSVQNKEKYMKTLTTVKSLLLNYQPNTSKKYQPQGFWNQLMSTQRGKTGDDEGEAKEENKKSWRSLDHITRIEYGRKGNYERKIEFSTQVNLKYYAEESRRKSKFWKKTI